MFYQQMEKGSRKTLFAGLRYMTPQLGWWTYQLPSGQPNRQWCVHQHVAWMYESQRHVIADAQIYWRMDCNQMVRIMVYKYVAQSSIN